MKLVEIKNSLAKLYYQPKESPLVLSDFVLVDDGNQKILAQVISIESTSKENTNCAILKFSLDIVEGGFSPYSGYTPALDTNVQKAPSSLIANVFSNTPDSFCIGNLTASDNIPLNINASVLDNFLYLQADVLEERQSFFEKVAQYNKDNNKKTVILDFDNLTEYSNVNTVDLCGNFKLPISNEILDYIYENDLTGLTVEQKTVVQDILLEIREYISTLETGFIPFNTLLEVVNSVYETDKSTGVILFRNKLLKYQQLSVFASEPTEIISLTDAVENNMVTVFNLSKAESNWQKEAVKFLIQNIEEKVYFVANVTDDSLDTNILDIIYKQDNICPIISSGYLCRHAQTLKSMAKNIILFRPQEQQKSFASYNSFLSKLAHKEFIVSGETTFYTPLIVKELSDIWTFNASVPPVSQVQTNSDSVSELEPIAESDTSAQLDFVDSVQEASLEDEIAQDVDKMFYGSTETLSEQNDDAENIDEMLTEDDLDILDGMNFANTDIIDDLPEIQGDTISLVEDKESVSDFHSERIDSEDDELLISQNLENSSEDLLKLADDSIDTTNDELPGFDELEVNLDDNQDVNISIQNTQTVGIESVNDNSTIPVYSPEIETVSDSSMKITAGNIVYHEKFGKGVVEEIFQHGSKVFCAIIFDKVGRRLLDPNVADIKQV